MFVPIAFAIAVLAGFGIVAFSLIQLISKRFQFWPPPSTDRWQYWTFWALFRVIILGLIVLSVFDFGRLSPSPVWRYYLGVPLGVLGFGAAFYFTSYLGWRNAYGADQGLKTNGIYQWCRNPIYVVTIVGMIGWGMTVASAYVWMLLTLWALFYVVAPFLEEPWLEQRYRDEYVAYKTRVPRFF